MAAKKGVKWTPEQKAKWYAARWGKRNGSTEFVMAKKRYMGKHEKHLNGHFDEVLGALKTEQQLAEQKASRLASAVQAMEALRA